MKKLELQIIIFGLILLIVALMAIIILLIIFRQFFEGVILVDHERIKKTPSCKKEGALQKTAST